MGNLRGIATNRAVGSTRGGDDSEIGSASPSRLTRRRGYSLLFAIRSPIPIYETLFHLAGFSRFELLDFSLESVELVPI